MTKPSILGPSLWVREASDRMAASLGLNRSATVPLFAETGTALKVAHCGCGVLLRIAGHFFVLSAAHVIDAIAGRPVCTIDGGTVPIGGQAAFNVPREIRKTGRIIVHPDPRDHDVVDVAVIRLTSPVPVAPGKPRYRPHRHRPNASAILA